MRTAFERHASRRGAHFAQTDPDHNKGFIRRWEDPAFVRVGIAVDAVTKRLAIEAVLRLIARAENASGAHRLALVNHAVGILRTVGLDAADMARACAA